MVLRSLFEGTAAAGIFFLPFPFAYMMVVVMIAKCLKEQLLKIGLVVIRMTCIPYRTKSDDTHRTC